MKLAKSISVLATVCGLSAACATTSPSTNTGSMLMGGYAPSGVYASRTQSSSAPTAATSAPSVFDDSAPAQRSKQIKLDRVVQNVPPGTVIGDWSCGRKKQPVVSEASFRSLDAKYFSYSFGNALSQAGYQVKNTGDSLYQDEGMTEDAQLLVGASIIAIQADGCLPEWQTLGILFPNAAHALDTKLDATLTVQWEVFDPLTRRVVAKATTQGRGSATRRQNQRETLVQDAFLPAFAQAAQNLAMDLAFRQAAFASDPDPVTAAGPPSPRTIAHLPHSVRPFQEQVPAIQKQVVTVYSSTGSGSGFYISDTLLLTNRHVVGGGKAARVKFLDGREIAGEVLAGNAGRDVALIKTDPIGLLGLPIRLDEPNVGSDVFVIGNPLGKYQNTVTSGIVSGFPEKQGRRFIQSNANIQPGNSGGPMFDGKGNVIGVSVAGLAKNDVSIGINFFIPIAEALDSVSVSIAPEKKRPKKANVAATN